MAAFSQPAVISTTSQVGDQAIETADIADNAVTPAKLSHGTNGQVLVMESNAPAWGTAPGGYTRQVFTADGTWTKPANLVAVLVRAWGAGAGSGHQENISNEYLEGAGAGAYSEKRIAAASLGATETVTVGVGGPAGAATGTNGSNGEDTTFGAHLTAGGGVGGKGSDNTSGTAPGALGGTATGGDVNIPGDSGGPSIIFDADTRKGGDGGRGFGGGQAKSAVASDVTSAVAGVFPGGGAAGCGQGSSSSAIAGAAGADGLVIVEEYY